MNLLQRLMAVHTAPASVARIAAAAVPAADPDYIAYLAQVEAGNARRAKACKRCGGAGYLREYAHINGGRCFNCDGASTRVDPAMSYAEWLRNRADSLGLDGFDVMVQE